VTQTTTRIPLVDVVAQHREVAERLRQGIETVIAMGTFVDGPQVGAFERDYATHAHRRRCVGVANGTDALRLALGAAGVRAGDEVIIPAQTFVATAEAVMHLGATPVMADTDPVHHLIDPERVAERIGPRTRAIVPVHLFGQMAPMVPLRELARRHGLAIVEDAAQAHGASQHGGHPGDGTGAATTSFYPGKNLGACGDAGAVLTDHGHVADAVRAARDHRRVSGPSGGELVGGNARLDSIQAVVLSAKLQRLQAWNTARRHAAQRYDELLATVECVETPVVMAGNVHVWHLYPILVPAEMRDALVDRMHAAGIGCGVHYRDPVHLHPGLGHLGGIRGDCPNAEDATARLVSLPMHPHLSASDQERVVEALAEGLVHG
jgi:dTDP-4-amino-4,6-dideoxygalactose transaminase